MPSLRSQPVAVVGVAAEVPGSGADLDGFAATLERRGDLVAPVGEDRRRDGGYAADTPLSECALLDRIDLFDPGFFGLSRREAEQMDPQQRFLLQMSARAIWDSGRALADLAGSRTAVVLGAARETYSGLADPADPPLVTGLLPAAQAGRVAYLLDLRGPAHVVDTACSSSLAAVLEALRLLADGRADAVLTGGVRLFPVPPAAVVPGNESVLSPTGRARSFDAAADGTALGEGGALFLLKPLDAAREAGDPVHAVLLGGASNHDGARCAGFAAPSAEAQEELLLDAWDAAGVHPRSLGMVEGHATGTRLGDPIEFEALAAAFTRRTDRTDFCSLGSAKSNVGHLDSAAGALGLLKGIVSVARGRRYAPAHLTTPNPLLATEGHALRLHTDTEDWESVGPRRAGVSAFGMTGTNVHLVVEQAPDEAAVATPTDGASSLLVPLAARSEAGLRRHARRLAAHLRASGGSSLADVARVQAVGRDHERHRATVTAPDSRQAAEALDRLGEGPDGDDAVAVADATVVVPVLPDELGVDPAAARAWRCALPALQGWYERQLELVANADADAVAQVERLLDHMVVVRALTEAGVPDRVLIGHGRGNLLVDLLRGGRDLLEAAKEFAEPGAAAAPDPERIDGATAAIAAQGAPVFVPCWPGRLADAAAAAAPRHRGRVVELAADPTDPRAALLDVLAALYRAGVALDWDRTVTFLGGYGRRVHVPTDLFAPQRCWLPVRVPAAADGSGDTAGEPAVALPVPEGDLETDAERTLAAIWASLLGLERIERDQDFFLLGGDSLMQVQLENAVSRDFGVALDFDAVYDHPTLAELAWHVDGLRPAPAAVGAAPVGTATVAGSEGPLAEPGRVTAPAARAQRRMWLLQQLDRDSGLYNVSSSFVLDGAVDTGALRAALDDLAERHAVLRTALVLDGGELTQHVAEPHDARPELDEVVVPAGTDPVGVLRDHAARPFRLDDPRGLRALVVTDQECSGRTWFQVVLHHASCDEWSMGLLLDELAADYTARHEGIASPVPAPRLQFVDCAVWEREQEDRDGGELGRHWQERLAGAPTELELPADLPRTGRADPRGDWLPLHLPAELVSRGREFSRERQGTVFTWLLTGYAAWIARVTQREDFLVGVPVAGRSHADLEAVPGCFVNTLPIRVDASGDPGFGELLARVRAALADAFSHQRHPFDLMVEALGAAGGAAQPPLVQTLLSLQGAGRGAERRFASVPLRPVELDAPVSWFDLSSVLWEDPDGGLHGIAAYRTTLFERTTVESFWNDWSSLLAAGIEDPHTPVHALLQDESW